MESAEKHDIVLTFATIIVSQNQYLETL
jgi:hypothetical protein